MANRRPDFQIPDIINPPNRRCIQIMIPDDPQHVQIFAGLTRQLLDWQRWERDPLKRGTQVAQVWREVWNSIDWTGEDCMGCCPEPTNRRYNAAGQLEVSYDGGLTWSLAPDADDRYSGVVSPPLVGEDGELKRCTGAASAMEYVKQNLIDDLTSGGNYADLYAACIAVIAALGVTGIGVLIAAAAAAIFIAGVSAVQAAFTTEVWSDFQCILFCNMESDASFTEDGWEQIKAEILSTFTGVVSAVLYNWVNSVGIVGLTNSARSGFATSPDCSDCPCNDEWCYIFDFVNSGAEDWVLHPRNGSNFGVYELGTGWVYTDNTAVQAGITTGSREVRIARTFANTEITKVTVFYNYAFGHTDSMATQSFDLSVGGTVRLTVPFSGMVNGSAQEKSWENLGVMATSIEVGLRSSRDPSAPITYDGNAVILEIQVEGRGTNPFGEDNC